MQIVFGSNHNHDPAQRPALGQLGGASSPDMRKGRNAKGKLVRIEVSAPRSLQKHQGLEWPATAQQP